MSPGDVLGAGYLVLLFVLYLLGPLLLGAGALFVGIGALPVRRRDARVMGGIAAVLVLLHVLLFGLSPFRSAPATGAALAMVGALISTLRFRAAQRQGRARGYDVTR